MEEHVICEGQFPSVQEYNFMNVKRAVAGKDLICLATPLWINKSGKTMAAGRQGTTKTIQIAVKCFISLSLNGIYVIFKPSVL